MSVWRKLLLPSCAALGIALTAGPTLAESFLASVATTHPHDVPAELKSRLTQKVELRDFGRVAYRGPIDGNTGPIIVLFHGVYPGASHRAFRELLPLLDQGGARVYVMDLPGAGDSEKRKRDYDMAYFDRFVAAFLHDVVEEPAVLVSEGLLGNSVLRISAEKPELVRRLVLLAPTGVRTQAEAPTPSQTLLFNRLYGSDDNSRIFYKALLSEASTRFFVKHSYFDDSLVDAARVQEALLAREDAAQRWLALSAVGGKLYRSFTDASDGVFVPTLVVFGNNAEPVVSLDADAVEHADDFRAIRPDFDYLVLDKCGVAVQREKTAAVAEQILRYAEIKNRMPQL